MNKRKTFCVAAMLLFAVASIIARNEWHEPPVVLLNGYEIIDSVSPMPRSAQAHVRLGAADSKACAWELQWCRIDSANYIAAHVQVPSSKGLESLYTTMPVVTVSRVVDGEELPLLSKELPRESAMISLKLVYDGVSARLYAGDSEAVLIGAVPYDAETGGMVAVAMEHPMRVQRISAHHDAPRQIAYSDFPDLESLAEYLADSNDALEGYWSHLDRDINQLRGSLGGKYTFAVAKNGDGAYDIIYLSGADINADHWQPLMIKGRMTPTQFVNHFDLVWYDAYGVRLDDDNHAQLVDNAILTLSFPVYSSQLRLRIDAK